MSAYCAAIERRDYAVIYLIFFKTTP